MNKTSKRNFAKGMKNIGPTLLLFASAITFLVLTAGCEIHKESPVKIRTGEWQCGMPVLSYADSVKHNCMGDYKTVRAIN